jgi:hypothetical protein
MAYPNVVSPGGAPGEIYRGWIGNFGVSTTGLSLDPGTYLSTLATMAAGLSPAGDMGPTGCLGQTMLRSDASNAAIALGATGTLNLYGVWLYAGQVISNITFVSGTTAASSPTHWWYGLYNSSRVQLATTADQTTTAFGASTAFTLAIAKTAAGTATSFTTTYTGWHYVGIAFAASVTVPTLTGVPVTAAINGIAPILAGTSDTSVTTPPAFPHTATAITATAGLPFAYLT